jgi:RHS repeat-associated protein
MSSFCCRLWWPIVCWSLCVFFLQSAVADPTWNAVYRFAKVNGSYQEHLYTTYQPEGAGYIYEGIEFYVAATNVENGVAVYRLRKDGTPRLRLYTTSPSERALAESAGYVCESTLGYIYASARTGTVPIYRVYKSSIGDRFYTRNYNDALAAVNDGYAWENNLGYAPATPPTGMPDLVITNVSAPSTASPGSSIGVDVTVKNQGSGNVVEQNTVLLRVVLSADTEITVTDTPQADTTINKSLLAAGQTTLVTVPLTVPQSGNYYVGAYIDAAFQHQESYENNNAGYKAQQLVIGSSPTLSAPGNGSTVTSETITFQWNAVTGATDYELWIDDDPTFASPEYNTRVGNVTSFNMGAWLSNDTYYWKIKAYTANGGQTGFSSSWSFTYNRTPFASPVWMPLYRLYHSSDYDHFYTANATEKNNAVASGWKFERIEFYLSFRPFTTGTPLFRLYHAANKNHYYTTSKASRNQFIGQYGFVYEGITGFAYDGTKFRRATGGVELYHVYHASKSDNFYTLSKAEKNYAISQYGFSDQGIAAYVSPDGKSNPFSSNLPVAFLGTGVDSSFGIFHYGDQDMSVPGRGLDFIFARVYISDNAAREGSLGFGWSHSFEARVIEGSSTAVVRWGDGNSDYYNVNGSTYTKFNEEITLYETLTKGGDTYLVTKKNQVKYYFQIVSGESGSGQVQQEARLQKIMDRNNNTIFCHYDSLERLAYVQDSANRQFIFTYNQQSKISAITDPIGRQVRYEYDGNNNLVTTYDAENHQTTYLYGSGQEALHHLVKITYPKGNYLQNTYDMASGHVSQQIDSRINPSTATQFDYTTPNQVKATDPFTRLTTYGQNTNRLSSFQAASGPTASIEYSDANNPGQPTRVVDRMGYATNYTYDTRGNMLSTTNALGQRTEYTYNALNDVTSVKDALNHTTNYNYDGQGNLSSVVDALGHSTNFYYNEYGQITRVSDPAGKNTWLEYDAYGNVSKVKDDRTGTTSYFYDSVGRLTAVTDPENNTTLYEYDKNDNLKKTTDAKNNVITYSYDFNNNLTQVVFNGHTTQFVYDSQDRLEKVIDPLNKENRYQYHPNGKIWIITTEKGEFIEYTYDTRNRLTDINYSGGAQVHYSYTGNENDRITGMSDWLGSASYTYDQLNRLTSYTNPYNKTVSYGFDAVGRRTSITYPGNKMVSYTYYNDNRLATVADWLYHTTSYQYDMAGNLTDVALPNSTSTQYQYNAVNQRTAITHKKSDQSILASYQFTLDQRGYPTVVDRQLPLAEAFASIDRSFSHNLAEQVTSAGTTSFVYDNCGNMTSRNAARTGFFDRLPQNKSDLRMLRATTTYTYDVENRLTGMQGPGGNFTYAYDGMGNRLARSKDGTTTRYVLDIAGSMTQVLCETDAANNVTNYYVYGLGLISRISATGTQHCYHGDHIGSIAAMTDASQNITHKYAYAPYGQVLAKTEADANPFRYIGQLGVMDEDNGLLFMRARYYDTDLARFINKDPIGMKGGLNLYAYANGNPMVNVDPEGTWFKEAVDVASNTVASVGDVADVLGNQKLASWNGFKAAEFISFANNTLSWTTKLMTNKAPTRQETEAAWESTLLMGASVVAPEIALGFGLAFGYIDMMKDAWQAYKSLTWKDVKYAFSYYTRR